MYGHYEWVKIMCLKLSPFTRTDIQFIKFFLHCWPTAVPIDNCWLKLHHNWINRCFSSLVQCECLSRKHVPATCSQLSTVSWQCVNMAEVWAVRRPQILRNTVWRQLFTGAMCRCTILLHFNFKRVKMSSNSIDVISHKWMTRYQS